MKKQSVGRSKFAALCIALLLSACGGGGGGGDSNTAAPPAAPPVVTTPPVTVAPNTLAVTVDPGPVALTQINSIAANVLFATVTICTPGSTTACRTVDHIQVDTGSTGLRILASAIGSAAVPTPVIEPLTARPLLECVQFADGYSYGSVGTVDVQMGSRNVASLPIQVIGDPAAGTAPSGCVSGPAENTVVDFGANGVLGIGNFLQDCGPACAQRAVTGTYYVCPASGGNGSSCTPVAVALALQVPNPVSRLATDNNGVVVSLPAVPSPGATSVAGTVYFGVATQTDNALGVKRVYTLDSLGTFTATSNGSTLSNSFIDSGSNAYFFPSSGIPVCADNASFYCPVTSSGVATSISQTATITGTNGAAATVSFVIDNADQLFTNSTITAFPGLAGPNGILMNGTGGGFDFGLPFFFGRNVAILIETFTVAGSTGPAVAF